MIIDIITLFPESFTSFLNHSIIKRAQEKNLLKVNLINLRNFGLGNYQQVDDTPYGGGAGMVIRADVATGAIKSLKLEKGAKVISLSPRGRVFNQDLAKDLSQTPHLVLFNPHYEGVDQRFIDNYVDLEVSVGDYVLSGGEVASMVIVDAVARLIPGVLGNESSNQEESFDIKSQTGQSLLEYPHYTKPAEFEGEVVPDVLLSGDHQKIKLWREEKALQLTKEKRPDLLEK